MHLRQLNVRLGAFAGGQRCVADDVAKSLSTRALGQSLPFLELPKPLPRKDEVKARERAYLSVSYASNTFRFVWSRMIMVLTKQPMSSFLAR